MPQLSKDEQYAFEISQHILEAFDDDSHDKKWDLDTIDATAWFTGLVKASAIIFNKLTGNDNNFIEFTHTAQNLLIQSMMKEKKAS